VLILQILMVCLHCKRKRQLNREREPMANMAIKHSAAQFQCSCCDKGGKVRRSGRKAAKAKEAKAWKDSIRKGEA